MAQIGRLPKRPRTERLIAMVLICAGVVAWLVDSLAGSALFWIAGASLFLHGGLLSLWSDD